MRLLVIGTGSSANIKLNSQYVSSYHAEILLLDNGDILLTDKGSKNGTYINDQRLQPNKDIPIKRGDPVRFADKILDWSQIPVIQVDPTQVKEIRGIGTNYMNKYQLQGDRVSRFHATLKRKKDNQWYIQDHSKNGTTVNGQIIPSNQDVKLKRGDKIACAGVPVINPYGDAPAFDFRKIARYAAIVLLICGGIYGIKLIYDRLSGDGGDGPSPSPVISDEQIYAKYKNSTVLLIGFYYYKVSAGNLDLERDCGLPTEVVLDNGKIHPIQGNRSRMNVFTGTGFFISKDGKIVTNLHISRPWLFDKELSLISDKYKMLMASAAAENPALNAFTAQIQVEGVMSYLGMLPNGAYFSDENLKQCRELVGHDDTDRDVAILQLESKRLPDEHCGIVDLGNAVVHDSEIRVGSHIYTMGFPFGLSLQDLKSSKGVQILANGGSITQECTDYSFGFNAPSYGGASGSPIFNAKGQLIGVLNSGVTKSQGFNFAIKAVHVKELLDRISDK